jgi:hypothetical protein
MPKRTADHQRAHRLPSGGRRQRGQDGPRPPHVQADASPARSQVGHSAQTKSRSVDSACRARPTRQASPASDPARRTRTSAASLQSSPAPSRPGSQKRGLPDAAKVSSRTGSFRRGPKLKIQEDVRTCRESRVPARVRFCRIEDVYCRTPRRVLPTVARDRMAAWASAAWPQGNRCPITGRPFAAREPEAEHPSTAVE